MSLIAVIFITLIAFLILLRIACLTIMDDSPEEERKLVTVKIFFNFKKI